MDRGNKRLSTMQVDARPHNVCTNFRKDVKMTNLKERLNATISELKDIEESIDCDTNLAQEYNNIRLALISLLKAIGAKYDENLIYEYGERNDIDKKLFATKILDLNDNNEILKVIDTIYSTLSDVIMEKSNCELDRITFNIQYIETLRNKDSFIDLLRGILVYKLDEV